ncbi:MAG: B12-binding domain-containing radical SAM protein [Candidatus Electronema sp. V4]|uniref:B12-binding domain-containing radical SAM protein n=1 Tax=Candidatus Electronema sp. V4 TaxID=3454756 RepID=UPI00405592DB
MKVKFILPSLTEAGNPYWRPIKYSLFPPLGLATLAAYLDQEDEVVLQDQHVEALDLDDEPDLVLIQVYITNAKRAYAIAQQYRNKGIFVAFGGLHVTSLPDEAARFADAVFIGPAEQTFPTFLRDFKNNAPQKRYVSTTGRTLNNLPPIRRDLIKRRKYLVPNSLVISRGCPHHCDFCYKDAFFKGGKSFYTRQVNDILAEIEQLAGRHLYFLDDHLLGNPVLARKLFAGMRGMGRVFQGAATVASILKDDLIERAAEAGLGSLFVGFETFSEENLQQSNKQHNLKLNYELAVKRLHDLGIMINGSFIFGLDRDTPDVFQRTVDWGIKNGLATATYHILTPYPGTRLFEKMEQSGRMLTRNWELYDTRHVVYAPTCMTAQEIEDGYWQAYREFYTWKNIFSASCTHKRLLSKIKHLCYTGGWKKIEPLWNALINLGRLENMMPLLETLLAEEQRGGTAD